MLKQYVNWLVLGAMWVAVGLGAAPAWADEPSSTLMAYSTVERLLSGELLSSVTVDEAVSDLSAFPADWPVVGLGTTDWVRRNGEQVVDGTAGDPDFLWVDPGYDAPVGRIVDLEAAEPPQGEFPFLGIAVCDPETSLTWEVSGVADIHAWLEERIAAEGIELAAVRVEGEFGDAQTSVAYNLPLTGLDLSGGYVGDDFFRFGDYSTSTWVIEGLYAADPELQAVLSTAGHPLHLHGYQPDALTGGHIQQASAVEATAVVWPIDDIRTGVVLPDAMRVQIDLADDADEVSGTGEDITDAADLLAARGADIVVDEGADCVIGRLEGTGPGIGLVASFGADDSGSDVLPGEYTGAALVLDLVRRFSALPADVRPAITVVGVLADEDADLDGSPCMDALDDSALSVLVAPSFAEAVATGTGPVVVWDATDAPDWAVDLIAANGGIEGAAAVDVGIEGLDAPVVLIAPQTPVAGGDGEMAVASVEDTTRLLIELLDHPDLRTN